jgi:hypothetical protein
MGHDGLAQAMKDIKKGSYRKTILSAFFVTGEFQIQCYPG